VPKNPFGIRLAIFDRCAKDCSLNRPQGAFRNLCPWGNQNVTASALPVLFFMPARIRTRSSPLAVPKNPFGIRLAIFDRCAKNCSLNRPRDALHSFCPWGNQNVTASALPVLFFMPA